MWKPKDELPTIPGVYRVKHEDHTGVHETLPSTGGIFYAYFDGVDTWSSSLHFTVSEALSAPPQPGLRHEWYQIPSKGNRYY